MKRFKDLTDKERVLALDYAMEQLDFQIDSGLIYSDESVSEEDRLDYAYMAAETAWYGEKEDKVIWLQVLGQE